MIVQPIPPLEPGDRLSLEEFERRYEAMPELKKAELIEGVVHVASPVRADKHGEPHAHAIIWLGNYLASTPGVRIFDNSSTKLDKENMLQPDVALVIDPSRGGQTRIGKKGYLHGPPEMAVEIAASTASIDLHVKFRVYRRKGVLEYLVWRVLDNAIDWFILEDREYRPLELGPDGCYHSRVFPGLRLDPAALLKYDLPKVMQTLNAGLATSEHASFVAKLAGSAAP